MRETDFIKQNKEKWLELEKILSLKEKDPDKLSTLFVHVSDDLSYSRTFYKNRSVRVYLNSLAQQVFHSIYKTKPDRKKQFIHFWKEELPQLVYESRKELLLSFIIFILSALIGVVSYANDPSFAHVILGKQYIEMTNENIKSGDPMAVYKKMNEVDMFLGITFNNVMVAFRTFIMGIFFAIGTVAIMIYNGIMIGVFQYFFYQKGLFIESSLAIWLHGTLEISSIIIAGAAGITLGKGLVFPGTLTRLQSFQLSAQRGLKLLLSILPILVFAAIIESFLTRHTQVPNVVRFIVILLSLAFIIGYFIYYPFKKARQGFKNNLPLAKLAANRKYSPSFSDIKSPGELFTDVFLFYRKNIARVFLSILITSVFYCVFALFLYPTLLNGSSLFSNLSFILKLFDYHQFPMLAVLNIFVFSIPLFTIGHYLNMEAGGTKNKPIFPALKKHFHKSLFITALIQLLLFLPLPLNWLLVGVFVLPFSLLWHYASIKEEVNVLTGINRTFSLLRNGTGKFFILYILLAVIGTMYYLLIDSPLVYSYFEILNWNLNLEQGTATKLLMTLTFFTSLVAFQLLLPILYLGNGFLYYSLKEINDAGGLHESIKKFAAKIK